MPIGLSSSSNSNSGMGEGDFPTSHQWITCVCPVVATPRVVIFVILAILGMMEEEGGIIVDQCNRLNNGVVIEWISTPRRRELVIRARDSWAR